MNVTELYFDFLKNYAQKKLKATTIRGYVTNFEKYIFPICCNYKLYELDVSVIDEIVDNCSSANLSNTSIIYVLSTFSKMLNYAVKRNYCKYNILKSYDYPRKDKFNYTVLSMEEMNKLIDYSWFKTNCSVAFILACHYGLRRGEICALKTSDIDFVNHTIMINKSRNFVYKKDVIDSPKNDKARVILLSDYDIYLLSIYNTKCKSNKNGYFLRYIDGKCISPNVINKTLKSCLNGANLPCVRFHDLRHSYATHMIQNNISPKTVSSVLGHSTVKFTLDTYVHYNVTEQKELLNLL